MDRAFALLREKNPNLAVRKRHTMPPPQLVRVGTKKTMWANYAQMSGLMHRSPEHVFQFFMSELATEGSIDANMRLVIKGRYVPKQIESLLKKYIGTNEPTLCGDAYVAVGQPHVFFCCAAPCVLINYPRFE
jgi:translation initiation factor 2 subunit 2